MSIKQILRICENKDSPTFQGAELEQFFGTTNAFDRRMQSVEP